MAKKNFDNLVNNMLGVDQTAAPTLLLETSPTETVAPRLTAPTKTSNRTTSSDISESFCGRASSAKLSKLRFIAEWENIPIKDIYNAAFDLFIKAYEAKHGEVKVVRKKNKGDINNLL